MEHIVEDRVSALLTKDTNKLAVYLPNDYFVVTINGKKHFLEKDELIQFKGKSYTAGELYEKCKNS